MTDVSAKIRAKGLDSTGVTEEIASQWYSAKGRSFMAIVEIEVVETHAKADGKRRVDCVLTQVEPSMDDNLSAHLRELTRTLYYNRQIDEQGPTLDDALAPSVSDVLSQGAALKPHPYLASTLSTDDNAICDVCGQADAVALHNMPSTNPFDAEDEDEEPEGDADASDEPADAEDEPDAAGQTDAEVVQLHG